MTLRSIDPRSEEQRSSSLSGSGAPALVQQETVVTHGPTQNTTEQRTTGNPAAALPETAAPASMATSRTVVRDQVGERRRTVSQATQIIWYVVGLFEALLALRLALLVSGANPEAGFTQLVFGFTKPLVVLFLGIFPNMAAGSFEFEPATVVAMLVYFLLGLGLARLAWILYGEPREIA